MELEQLEAILSARRADPKSYPPAENPYRITYAIYNMTDPEVIRRLGEAAKAGIRVQVLIDSHQISPDKPWNTVVQELKSHGLTSHAESNKGLSPEQLRDTQIIEVEMGAGIFHLKARHFSYPDPATGQRKEVLLTGSHNPQESAHKNDESLHRITDLRLISKYMAAIESVRDGKPIRNGWDASESVNVLFTSPTAQGPRVVDKIFELVRAEKEMIFLSVFTLRNITDGRSKLVDELIKAKERGVKVVVVTDHKQADGVDLEGKRRPDSSDDDTDDRLQRAGIPTYEVMNTAGPFNAMHLKSAVFGLSDMKVVTDAGNWTYATMGGQRQPSKNAESVLFIDSGKYDQNRTGQQYLGEFLRVLRKYDDRSCAAQAQKEKVVDELLSHPSWPKVKVNFDVLARTHLGQDVYIAGGLKELGKWGEGGLGLKLDTNPDSYPYWKRADLDLPLGMAFEYKVVKRDADGRLDWEPGQNAILVVDPTQTADPGRLQVSDDFNGDQR